MLSRISLLVQVYRQHNSIAGTSFNTLNIPKTLQAKIEVQFADGKRIVFHHLVGAHYLKALIACIIP